MAKWGEIKCARCAALEERLEAAQRDAKEAEAYAEELEAKLAKAVEVLGGVMRHMPDHPDTVWIEASETLAELTGGSDE